MVLKEIKDVLARYPEEFKLASFPGSTFRIDRNRCYLAGENHNEVQLIVERYIPESESGDWRLTKADWRRYPWLDFSRTTPSELDKWIVE
jgi:hypothetical protein